MINHEWIRLGRDLVKKELKREDKVTPRTREERKSDTQFLSELTARKLEILHAVFQQPANNPQLHLIVKTLEERQFINALTPRKAHLATAVITHMVKELERRNGIKVVD